MTEKEKESLDISSEDDIDMNDEKIDRGRLSLTTKVKTKGRRLWEQRRKR